MKQNSKGGWDYKPFKDWGKNYKDEFLKCDSIKGRFTIARKANEWTQDNVALELGMSRSAISRLENGQIEVTESMIESFSKLYGLSCLTILSGVEKENYHVVNALTGLSQPAIEWLAYTKNHNSDILEMVNLIFGKKAIADCLFEIFNIYAKLHVPSFVEKEDGTLLGRVSSALSNEEELLRGVMSDYIQEILMRVRNVYSKERLYQDEKVMAKQIENLRMSMDSKYKG